MVITLTLFGVLTATLLTGLIYYKGKYWNYEEISNAAEKELESRELEFDNLVKEMQDDLQRIKKNYKNKCQKDLKKKIQKIAAEKEQEIEQRYEKLKNDLELEYFNACEDVKKELFEQLETVDNAIAEHAKELAMKNILTFSCSCSRDLIPCPIDFSKENTFICPKCGSKYRVSISANPILIGRSISDEEFAELVEERLNDNKTKN